MSDMQDNVEHPGAMLREHMVRSGMNQRDVAAALGRHEAKISVLVNEKDDSRAKITAMMAVVFEEIFPGTTGEEWLMAQYRWDLARERRRRAAVAAAKMKAPS